MIDWMVGFVEKMFDSWGGAQYARTAGGIISYPKTTMTVSSILQASVDVWINIGPRVYWNDSQRLYEWMTGNNELSVDLQSAVNIAGSSGGFYEGIAQNGTLTYSDLALSALALYAMVRAAFVSIPGDYPVPEFPSEHATTVLVFALILVISVVARRKSSEHVVS